MPHHWWPVDPALLAPFLLAAFLMEITPGPNMTYLAVLSVREGHIAGVRAVLGVTLGLSAYMLAAAFGLTEVLALSPLLYSALRWSGVAFLLWIAWDTLRGGDLDVAPSALDRPFWRGLIANLLNPKAALLYVTLLPNFIAPDHAPVWAQAIILGSCHIAISIAVHAGIVMSAGRLHVFTSRAFSVGGDGRFRRGSAAIIALTALWLAWETQR